MSGQEGGKAKLIMDARQGSSGSLDQLLEFYRPYIFRLAEETIAPWLRPKLSAADVAQGTILLAWDRFQQFDGSTSSDFRAWLLAIFRNHLRDGIRRFCETEKRSIDREAGLVSPLLPNVSASPADQFVIDESIEKLLQCIDDLPDRARRVVRMRYIEAKSFPEIGKELDCTPDMARRIWLAAIDELAKGLRS
ncbi:MAG: sigma-70 family RNA polymerase sigma factor [Planctomycetota bacterium]